MNNAYNHRVYRRLWRTGHYAVQNRPPAKYAIRETLRRAFRTGNQLPTPIEIDNTEQFLRTAGRRRGLENNIVKSLCQVHYSRSRRNMFPTFGIKLIAFRDKHEFESLKDFYLGYERCVDSLNKTAGL